MFHEIVILWFVFMCVCRVIQDFLSRIVCYVFIECDVSVSVSVSVFLRKICRCGLQWHALISKDSVSPEVSQWAKRMGFVQ